jgi:hypothetical protein
MTLKLKVSIFVANQAGSSRKIILLNEDLSSAKNSLRRFNNLNVANDLEPFPANHFAAS